MEQHDICYINPNIGYMISIIPEEERRENGHRYTGRILVSHSQQNGKKVHIDLWDRDREGTLYFKLRNLPGQPFSDPDYIRDLESQISILQNAGAELQKENQKLIFDIQELQKNYQPIKPPSPHNARNAGRKKSDAKWMARYNQCIELYESDTSINKITDIMNISRSTYFRYLKYYQTNGNPLKE